MTQLYEHKLCQDEITATNVTLFTFTSLVSFSPVHGMCTRLHENWSNNKIVVLFDPPTFFSTHFYLRRNLKYCPIVFYTYT